MGSPVSPVVANLYMEEVERKALASFLGATPSHWFRYVDDTWVKIQTHEVEAFTDHIHTVVSNIKFTREDVKDNVLAFLDCAVHLEADGCLNVEVYRKPTHPYVSIINIYSLIPTILCSTSWVSSEPSTTVLRVFLQGRKERKRNRNTLEKPLKPVDTKNGPF